MTHFRLMIRIGGLLIGLFPGVCLACACGCGVFSVGTSSLLPSDSGGTVFFETDYMNQDENWNGTARAPLSQNGDKQIRTDFYTVGAQYMFNRSWGIALRVPYWNRFFSTTSSGGNVESFDHSALGDIRVLGLYTGLSGDMSTGLIFGVKLPTGDYTYPGFDRDTSIGTGSTDLILGAYHEGTLTSSGSWDWFVQGQWEAAVDSRDGYHPGNEADVAAGAYYNGWTFGATSQLAPVLQLIASDRNSDSGANADPQNSGYQRLLFAPGLEFDTGNFRFYGDLELPVYQNTTGNQLVAPRAWKFIVSYGF